VRGPEPIPVERVPQDSLYEQAADTYGPALDRLAQAYELDPEVRRDLLQEIHLQLWRSFAHFDQRCSLRTWVYRVAHNVATGHVIRQRRIRDRLVSIESIEAMPGSDQNEVAPAVRAAASIQASLPPPSLCVSLLKRLHSQKGFRLLSV